MSHRGGQNTSRARGFTIDLYHLEDILKDRRSLGTFKSFLKSEYAEENLEFFFATRDFKAQKHLEYPLSHQAKEIYSKFIEYLVLMLFFFFSIFSLLFGFF